jgi:hypothetical protein
VSSAADIGYLVGALVGLLIVLGLLVGGILLVVSARKSARAARQQVEDPYSVGPPVSRGTGKLVGGIVMIVIGGLGLLGRCAAAVNGL